MKIRFGHILGVLLLGVSSSSLADGLFLEPALTYQTGETTVSYPSPFSNSEENVEGLGLGLRVGVHASDALFLALDGRYARPTYDSSALGGRAEASVYNTGLTLGVQTPLAGLRVWGTYLFDGELNPNSIKDIDVKFGDFEGYRVGAGVYFAVVSVNLEYQEGKYYSTTVEDARGFTGTYDSITAKDQSYILSVSFPIPL